MQNQVSYKPLPFFFVGKAVTNDRIGSYVSQKHSILSNAIGKPDTKSIWYSKEHLTKLLEEIEHAGGDGIRIHLGMYEQGHEFQGQLCLVMNTTRELIVGNNTYHPDIVLENEADFAERSTLERDVIVFPGDDPISARKKDFNFGSPCPPLCDPPPTEIG
ncbi:hypothetical protein ESA94_13365 [Lacibacter luteus]|uniref:Uncharacterized protein n=1 Tax=Lacibacter luteus TaxID=2508719 RepID=A0A4Q1CI91_9BACT|nr:hypothetical protein [Lacibacter luteus]RXK60030.1 hypothetical protein ESA94_13365 [Lacibacter luteus]